MTTDERVTTDTPGEEVQEPDDRLPELCIADLPEALRAAAARMGWTALMPVQAKAIPYILADRDLMVQSRNDCRCFLLPAPAEQSECAEASGERRKKACPLYA